MRNVHVQLQTPIADSFRVRQVAGMFDLPVESVARVSFEAELPDESDAWQIGAIVGPSGSGKTALARAAFGPAVYAPADWPEGRAVIDCLGDLPIKQITRTLTAVGFSSPPSWLKPYAVLSTGERFRCDLARALLGNPEKETRGREDAETRGQGDAGTRGHGDAGTRRHGEAETRGRGDAETRRHGEAETRGRGDAETRGHGAPSCLRASVPSCLPLTVFDEFTSVVDRTVARIGSAAIAKAIRSGLVRTRFVAVTCHYDVLRWLQPDWVLDLSGPSMCRGRVRPVRPVRPVRLAALAQGGLAALAQGSPVRLAALAQGRPPIAMRVWRVDRSWWGCFERHHYLTGTLHPGARCFAGFIEGQPAAFTAVLPFPHAVRPGWREHRTVCLPDFQGVGVGTALSEFIASVYVATGKPYFSTTSHPAMMHHRAGSVLWKMIRKPGMASRSGATSSRTGGMSRTNSRGRNTAGFEYVGPARITAARKLGIV